MFKGYVFFWSNYKISQMNNIEKTYGLPGINTTDP